MKIFIGADHRGYKLKEELKRWLVALRGDFGEMEVEDCGAKKLDPEDDYVGFAVQVAKGVVAGINKIPPDLPFSKREESPLFSKEGVRGSSFKGVVICGSGVGVDVAANRLKGIRCGLGFDPKQVVAARRDDDINMLALAADYISLDEAKEMLKAFLEAEFKGGTKYVRRREKLDEIGGV